MGPFYKKASYIISPDKPELTAKRASAEALLYYSVFALDASIRLIAKLAITEPSLVSTTVVLK